MILLAPGIFVLGLLVETFIFIPSCGYVAIDGLGGAALGRAVAISYPHLCEADSTLIVTL